MNSTDNAETQIFQCLDLEKPKSFFLFAGAGSGKTRSLVNALQHAKKTNGEILKMNRKGIAVITYTNAACDEINHRLDYDSLFTVVTIHSFVWTLIQNYQTDIREWLRRKLALDINELEIEQSKGRKGTKADVERTEKITNKIERLLNLDQIKKFTYSPTGDNRTRESLNHSDVIEIASDFLHTKPLMQEILITRYPILFIDESQDTKARFIDVLFEVQALQKNRFCLGLFGDTMQRIYADGKKDLGVNLPEDWLQPAKKINYRCPARVVRLINKVRNQVDNQEQTSPSGKEEGTVRLFILNRENKNLNKEKAEKEIIQKMSAFTKDPLWTNDSDNIKILTLEHHMAAKRKNFFNLFEPLSQIDYLRTSLLDGTLPGLRYFTDIILPIVHAHRNKNKFEITRIVKLYSPLLGSKNLGTQENQLGYIKTIEDSINSLLELWKDGKNPTLIEVLSKTYNTGLFPLPEALSVFQKTLDAGGSFSKEVFEEGDTQDNFDKDFKAWGRSLSCTFDEIERYSEYISGKSEFDTHQGVKGLEFPRVMVIIDDEESRGFMFSYDKIFGVKEPTKTDIQNLKDGKETGIDRTLRLFYVACSRAEKSLAIVAYTDKPDILKSHVQAQGWFNENEIIIN